MCVYNVYIIHTNAASNYVSAIEISLDMIIKARESSGNFPKLPRIKNDEPFASSGGGVYICEVYIRVRNELSSYEYLFSRFCSVSGPS